MPTIRDGSVVPNETDDGNGMAIMLAVPACASLAKPTITNVSVCHGRFVFFVGVENHCRFVDIVELAQFQ